MFTDIRVFILNSNCLCMEWDIKEVNNEFSRLLCDGYLIISAIGNGNYVQYVIGKPSSSSGLNMFGG